MMFLRLRFLGASMKTVEQEIFLDSLPSMRFNSDEDLIAHTKKMYKHREFLENCEALEDLTNRIENYLLKRSKCSVAHLQCYYKLKEMRLISVPFKHNLHRKYLGYVLDPPRQIRNEHLQKYLWFLYDEGRWERELFSEAAELHTLKLHEMHEYMTGLNELPTWEPYLRISCMLKELGHTPKLHEKMATKKVLDKLNHQYYPYYNGLYNKQQLEAIQAKEQYDDPLLTTLCCEYLIKDKSQYDNYLQRVQWVEIEKHYERPLDVISWSDFPPILALSIANDQAHGSHDDIDNGLTQLFFRLCEHTDIDLQTGAQILSLYSKAPGFMYSRRFPIITRTTDSVLNHGLEAYSFLPADAYLGLLRASKLMTLDADSRKYMQGLVCGKLKDKVVWNEGEKERVRAAVESEGYEGAIETVASLSEQP